eukprot:RCo049408
MGSVEEVHFGSFSWIRMDIALLLSGVLDLAAADPLGLPLEIPLVVRLKIDPCQYPAPSSVTLVKCFHEEVSIPLDAQIQRLMGLRLSPLVFAAFWFPKVFSVAAPAAARVSFFSGCAP